MLDIKPFFSPDIPAALALCAQANWNHIAADWQRIVDLDPDMCVGGFEGRVLKATCSVIRFGTVGWVGTFLVDQSLRGKGCGKQVFEAMLNKARELGIEVLALDSSDAGRPIYSKNGFVMTSLGNELWTGPNAGEADPDAPFERNDQSR